MFQINNKLSILGESSYIYTSVLTENLRVKFAYQHPQDSIFILDEGNKPHPRFPQFEMFVPQEELDWSHPTSEMCRSGTEMKRRRLVVEET